MAESRPPQLLRFGQFELDADSGVLRRAGVRVALQDQPLRVLLCLLEHPGSVVTREELRRQVWGDTFVDFEHGLNVAVRRLRESLGDDAETSRFIETLPRRGYRFMAPVETSERRATVGPRARRKLVAATALGVLAAAAFGARLVSRHRREVSMAPLRSIAVLPLQSLSEDPTQQWFADALTEALTSAFSRIGSLTPVASTSTRSYSRTGKTPAQIADELGVDALLEGSASHSGDLVNVTVALVDPVTGRRLWAESYSREVGNALAIQNEIALSAARELSVMLSASEQERLSRGRWVNADAYVAYLRGKYLSTRWQEGGCRDAEPYLLKAAQLDPRFAPARATLAFCYVFPDRSSRPVAEAIPLARAAAREAIALDDQDGDAHVAMGLVRLRLDFDWAGAESELKRAIELQPGSARTHIAYAEVLATTGRADEALGSAGPACSEPMIALVGWASGGASSSWQTRRCAGPRRCGARPSADTADQSSWRGGMRASATGTGPWANWSSPTGTGTTTSSTWTANRSSTECGRTRDSSTSHAASA